MVGQRKDPVHHTTSQKLASAQVSLDSADAFIDFLCAPCAPAANLSRHALRASYWKHCTYQGSCKPRTYQLSYHNDCVIISRAHLPPTRGGRMYHAVCATITYPVPPRPFNANHSRRQNHRGTCHSSPAPHHFPNQSLAKHNRKPTQPIENNHQRPKSIASFCRLLDLQSTLPRLISSISSHESPITTHQFLNATHPNSEISQTHESKRENIF